MPEEGPYFKMSVGMSRHRKIVAAGGDAAWLWSCGLDYCAEQKSDGVIPVNMVPRLSDRRQPMKLARRLVDCDLWHEPGHQCKRCPQPMTGNFVIHDYLEHQRSADQIQAARDAKAAGGAYGNHRKWHTARDRPDPECLYCLSDGSVNRSHMREETESISGRKTIASASQNDRSGIADLDLDPEDIPPPTPPTGGRKPRRKAYDYSSDQDFLRFWDTYPIKKGKPEAYDAWLKAVARGADPESIITAAAAYRDDPGRDPRKSKYPQGWLSAERYNDEPASDAPRRYSNSPYEN